MNKLAGFRRMLGLSQEEMAKKIGLSVTGYRLKENEINEFKKTEMIKIHTMVKDIMPDITLEDIFFLNNNYRNYNIIVCVSIEQKGEILC